MQVGQKIYIHDPGFNQSRIIQRPPLCSWYGRSNGALFFFITQVDGANHFLSSLLPAPPYSTQFLPLPLPPPPPPLKGKRWLRFNLNLNVDESVADDLHGVSRCKDFIIFFVARILGLIQPILRPSNTFQSFRNICGIWAARRCRFPCKLTPRMWPSIGRNCRLVRFFPFYLSFFLSFFG